ncbi:hypothetical protein OB905_09305 [Halobacteria archaeon AArc-dxtr1]|nr:hypothetical protein [Halobacteria archaeon AArc-dxtr1]
MSRPRDRAVLPAVAPLALVPGLGLASQYVPVEASWPVGGGLKSAVAAAALTVFLGALLLWKRQAYTKRVTDRIAAEPGRSVSVGAVVVVFAAGTVWVSLSIQLLLIVAIPVLLPVFLAFVVATAFGTVLAGLAVGRALVRGWTGALVVAALLSVVTVAAPYVGYGIGFALGSLGIGAMLAEGQAVWHEVGPDTSPPQSSTIDDWE